MRSIINKKYIINRIDIEVRIKEVESQKLEANKK